MAAPHVIGASEVIAMGHIGPARKRYDVLAVPATTIEIPAPRPDDPPVRNAARDPERGPRGNDERRGR